MDLSREPLTLMAKAAEFLTPSRSRRERENGVPATAFPGAGLRISDSRRFNGPSLRSPLTQGQGEGEGRFSAWSMGWDEGENDRW
jgi:hypothetical protein